MSEPRHEDDAPLPCALCCLDTDILESELHPLPAGVMADVVVFCPSCRRMMNELPAPAERSHR